MACDSRIIRLVFLNWVSFDWIMCGVKNWVWSWWFSVDLVGVCINTTHEIKLAYKYIDSFIMCFHLINAQQSTAHTHSHAMSMDVDIFVHVCEYTKWCRANGIKLPYSELAILYKCSPWCNFIPHINYATRQWVFEYLH